MTRGLLRDYKPSDGTFWSTNAVTPRDTVTPSDRSAYQRINWWWRLHPDKGWLCHRQIPGRINAVTQREWRREEAREDTIRRKYTIKMKMNANLWRHKCKAHVGWIMHCHSFSFGLIKEMAADISPSSGNRLPPCPSLQWPASRSISTVWALGCHCSIHLRLQTFLFFILTITRSRVRPLQTIRTEKEANQEKVVLDTNANNFVKWFGNFQSKFSSLNWSRIIWAWYL